jgi:aryl-alcohol dehydrogenase-like predicted oxidoreductase
MERVKLGSSELEVPRLCLGTWNMDGSKGWGPESDEDSIKIIREVVDSGFNFLDSAIVYGGGHSEEVVGRALEGMREKAIVATKVMQRDPAKTEGELDGALGRMRTDYLDLFIVHWPSKSCALDDFMAEMTRLRDKGKCRAVGVSNFNLEQMKVAVRHGAVSLQPPYNVLWRLIDGDVLPFCRENNVAVTPYSPLAQGLLTGRFTRGGEVVSVGIRTANALFKEPVYTRAKAAAGVVDRVADEIGVTSAQVALAWLLHTEGVTSPIVGVSSIEQWQDNLKALEVELSAEQYGSISEAGLEVWSEFSETSTMWG